MLISLVSISLLGGIGPRDRGPLAVDAIRGTAFEFGGVMGDRIRANEENWLLRAPDANPGMLEMFRGRDRHPAPELVPWAGEFAGKYLISAVQACRLTGEPRLREHVAAFVRELIDTQAEDGYLGPFHKEERLLGHWDLWGHYHVMLALLMWYAQTGDADALACASRAGDLICRTYLGSERRMLSAGSCEMNLAVIHSLGWLYRVTGEERTLRMVREIEKDWESAGDYYRAGLEGVPFYRTPLPRWESLHDVQGLVELYRITGDESYRAAFVQLWESIRRHDRHPSGGFSTGEQAIGNPYTPGAIETCCTIAWMALTVDMLRLTGNPAAADELELSTWNGMLGAQHPSGRWWTYDTPIDGVRKASAHHIVFQARHGTPELNCCSANAPRGLGMLSEWAVVADDEGLFVSFYGPCRVRIPLADGRLELAQETDYPADGAVRLRLRMPRPMRLNIRLRIPAWSKHTRLSVNGEPQPEPAPGTYLSLDRRWRSGDTVDLHFDLSVRHWAGALSRTGRAALYAGPILLAFDPHWNALDTDAIPKVDLAELSARRLERPAGLPRPGRFTPIVSYTVGTGDAAVTLCDFATAGAHGTDTVSWLPVTHAGPPPVWLLRPQPGERVAAGPVLFQWNSHGPTGGSGITYTLAVARDPEMRDVVARQEGLGASPCLLRADLEPGKTYYWKVTAANAYGAAEDDRGPQAFALDAGLPNTAEEEMALYRLGERGLMAASPLDGSGKPSFGLLGSEKGARPCADRFGREGGAVAFGGSNCGIRYRLATFPTRDYTFLGWVCPEGLPTDRLQQLFSAWRAGGDDPLRVVFQGDSLFARIEGGGFHGTPGVPCRNGEWIHVAAVKEGPELRLYVNGALKQTARVPEFVHSAATDFAIGANPRYSGNECLVGKADDFALHAEALSGEEVAEAYRHGGKPGPPAE